MNLNQIIFAGFAGGDAITRQAPTSGKPWSTFNLCQTQKGKEGFPDKSTWVTVKAFGYASEAAAGIKKGDNVIATGILQIEEYKAKDGTAKTAVCIIAHQVGVLTKATRLAAAGYTPGGAALPGQALPDDSLDLIPF